MQVRLADGSTLDRKGRINFADTRINPSTGTFEMRAEIANVDRLLKPGQFVRVKLLGAVRNNALAVPQVAVLDGPQGKFVYVAGKDKDGKDVARRAPGDARRLGRRRTAANLWVVESGLKPGDHGHRRRHRQAACRARRSSSAAAAPPATPRRRARRAAAPAPPKDAKSAPKA